jgi:hypothetical protein
VSAKDGDVQNDSSREEPLEHDDIHTGLSVMTGIYGIAIVLGLKKALEVSYDLFLSPLSSPSGALPHWVVLLLLWTILLLGLRFFWVPRNLYAYLLSRQDLELKKRLRWMTMLHFPITLIHALLFFCICEAYADLASSSVPSTSMLSAELASRVVIFYAVLLLLNSAWLLGIRNENSSKAEGIWGWSNLIVATVTFITFAIFKISEFSVITFTLIAVALFATNSAVDLWQTSEYYVLFPKALDDSSSVT